MKTRIASLLLAFTLLLVLLQPIHAQNHPAAGIINVTSNIRSSPGTDNPIVGSHAAGDAVEIVGCNEDCTWYQIGDDQWIAAFLVTAATATPLPPASPTPVPTAAPITIVGWNVESGGALQSVVADRMGSFDGVDIWGLSEVNAVDAEAFEFGAEEGEGTNYDSYLGTTGAADRLLLIWDEGRFDRINSGQLTEIGQNARAPLWVQLRETATGLEFIVMVNHLHRSNDNTRHLQAQMLNAWAAGQTLPVIATGDYNFDWNLPVGESDHDIGYDNMTKDGVWKWIRPADLVTTQCSGWPCGYTSVLDFVFAAGPAQAWNIVSEIIVAENDFPDDMTTPDHRPLMAIVIPLAATAQPILVPSVTASVAVAATATPAALSTVAPTPTAVCPRANGTANLRSGPGTGYTVAGSAQEGQCLTITGRTSVGDWFQLDNGSWIAAFLVDNPGPMAVIPVIAAPTPAATSIPPTSIPPTAAPAAPAPPTATPVPQPAAQNCDPSYPGVCIPRYPPDLDCGEVPYRRFQVIGSDPHGFDRDNDGIGCESN